MQEKQQLRLAEAFRDRLGEFVRDALEDPTVIEVMVNGCGRVWLDTLDRGRVATETVMHPAASEAIIRLVAHRIGAMVNEDHPLVAGALPIGGERFQGVLPPLTKAPAFTIRKRPQVVFHLEDYVESGALTATQAERLRLALAEHRNILVSGGTSSGKTTFLNALLAEPAIADDRIVLIEDTVELQCSAEDHLQLLTKRTEPRITIRDLVQTTLRLRPDRIVIGEIRDGAGALDMLKAWNTGHDGGLGTVHANHANNGSDALHRLEDLISEVATNVPKRLIAQAIDLVVHIRRTSSGRRIEEMLAVHGLHDGAYVTEPVGGADRLHLDLVSSTERTSS